jgi:hypothetical protein
MREFCPQKKIIFSPQKKEFWPLQKEDRFVNSGMNW